MAEQSVREYYRMGLSAYEMHEIYQQTVVIRRPTYGIVKGYHELPYVCVGESLDPSEQTTVIRGTIQVSPRFVIRPAHLSPNYEDIFGEDNVDAALSGRLFGYFGFRDKPVECTSERLTVEYIRRGIDQVLSETMDGLERTEDITTGVVITPNVRYYPVSIERFIASVLDDEFRV